MHTQNVPVLFFILRISNDTVILVQNKNKRAVDPRFMGP
jgi:hypothetical protein